MQDRTTTAGNIGQRAKEDQWQIHTLHKFRFGEFCSGCAKSRIRPIDTVLGDVQSVQRAKMTTRERQSQRKREKKPRELHRRFARQRENRVGKIFLQEEMYQDAAYVGKNRKPKKEDRTREERRRILQRKVIRQ